MHIQWTRAKIFAAALIVEYVVGGVLFAGEWDWKRALYYLGCAVKDIAILF